MTQNTNQTPLSDRRIPVTVLTGFLGSGKTTLLNRLLRHPDMAGVALLINEFGEVGIDHHLVESVDETMLILDSGCICCSVQGDLVTALRNLSRRSSRREIPEVTRVVIETTGLADPVPVVSTLTQERFVAARFRCDGVVTTIDATHGLQQLDRHREAVRQVTMADRLLLTKCELAVAPVLALLTQRLTALNPGASCREVHPGEITPRELFGGGIYATVDRPDGVADWLGAGQVRITRPAARGTILRKRRPAPPAHHRHGDATGSFVMEFDNPVPWYEFAVAMGRVLETHGPGILRVKGLMNIIGDPRPRVVHCVQEAAYPPVSLAAWPEKPPFGDRRGRLVFITWGLGDEQVGWIRTLLTGVARTSVGTRQIMAACPLSTRCWLFHDTGRGGSSLTVDGWDVQPIRMRARQAR